MVPKQPKRGNVTPSPSLEEAVEDPPKEDSGAKVFENDTKIYENTVVLRVMAFQIYIFNCTVYLKHLSRTR